MQPKINTHTHTNGKIYLLWRYPSIQSTNFNSVSNRYKKKSHKYGIRNDCCIISQLWAFGISFFNVDLGTKKKTISYCDRMITMTMLFIPSIEHPVAFFRQSSYCTRWKNSTQHKLLWCRPSMLRILLGFRNVYCYFFLLQIEWFQRFVQLKNPICL